MQNGLAPAVVFVEALREPEDVVAVGESPGAMMQDFVYVTAHVEMTKEQASEIEEKCGGAENLMPILLNGAAARRRVKVVADEETVGAREEEGRWVCRLEKLQTRDRGCQLKDQDLSETPTSVNKHS